MSDTQKSIAKAVRHAKRFAMLLFAIAWFASAPTTFALTATPSSTPTPTPTPSMTLTPPPATVPATSTSTPTSVPTVADLFISTVEPTTIDNSTGGTITILGSGFSAESLIRLVGYGLLNSTFVNGNTMTAQVPAGVPPSYYKLELVRPDITITWPGQLHITSPAAPTAIPNPTDFPTTTPTSAPTPTATPRALSIVSVEPILFETTIGGSLTVFGTGFTSESFLRLIGFGILPTTFVNETTLSATIPPNVPAGQFDLEVLRGQNSLIWGGKINLREPAGPTATPRPTLTPGLGPLWVSQVEPLQIERERGGNITVFGNNFTTSSVVRLVGFGILQTTYINETTLAAVVPPDLSAGSYSVQIVGDTRQSEWTGGQLVLFTAPTPTPSSSGSGTSSQNNRPNLLIQNISTGGLALPGEQIELRFELANIGQKDAETVSFIIGSSDVAIPVGGSNVRVVDNVNADDKLSVILPFAISKTAQGGTSSLSFDLTYFDDKNRSYTSQQTVGFAIAEVTPTPTPTATPEVTEQPRIILESYEVSDTIEPGSIFDLTMVLINAGRAEARDVTITLGGDGGQSLAPFALLNAGNVRFVNSLPVGERVEITQQFITEGSAAAKPYNLPLAVSYRDTANADQSGTFALSLIVENRPNFTATFFQPVFAQVGQPVRLPIEILNIGRNLVSVSTVELTTDPEIPVEDGSLFIGSLDGGNSATVEGTIFPEEAGTIDVLVNINYTDEFNRQQVLVKRIPLAVEGEPDFGFDEEGGEIIGRNPDGSPIIEGNAEPDSNAPPVVTIVGGILGALAVGTAGFRFFRMRSNS